MVLAGAALSAMLLLPVWLALPAQAGPAEHPMMQKALTHLVSAHDTLQQAIGEYGKSDPLGGHRVKALEHTNQALKEIRQALKM